MRKSTKYLLTIPVKFVVTLGLVFIAIYAVLRYVEYQSSTVGMISDVLAFYVFILAVLISIDGLIVMCEKWATMRLSESRIKRYLKKIMGNGF